MFLFSTVSTAAHEVVSGDGSVDLIIEDQLHKHELPATVTRPETTATVTQTPSMNLNTQNGDPTAANMPNVTRQIEGEAVKAKKSSTITTARAILPTSMPLTTTMSPSINSTTIAALAVPHLARVTHLQRGPNLAGMKLQLKQAHNLQRRPKNKVSLIPDPDLKKMNLKRGAVIYRCFSSGFVVYRDLQGHISKHRWSCYTQLIWQKRRCLDERPERQWKSYICDWQLLWKPASGIPWYGHL